MPRRHNCVDSRARLDTYQDEGIAALLRRLSAETYRGYSNERKTLIRIKTISWLVNPTWWRYVCARNQKAYCYV